MAFVVIQHLAPDFTSMMPQILSRVTRMPIKSVDGPEDIARNTVYLLPPGREMIISNSRLLTTERPAGLNLPVDVFFQSLAADQGASAVGIILSGTGSDGAAGVSRIHGEGGLTVAQTPESAEFDGMPKSAIATGAVAMILDPEHMPAALTGHAKRLNLSLGKTVQGRGQHSHFDTIFELLQKRYHVDFGHYKPNTIIRRTERRMSIRQSETLEQYTKLLAMDSDELEALYHDLLIGVTRFFRDAETWDFLAADVVPRWIGDGRKELRIWSAGCATGEEAYTLAILLHEATREMEAPPDIKIFATDVHQRSLDFASNGIYESRSLEGLSETRVRESFVQQGHEFAIAPHLRRMVVFARQDVTVDPPFTKLDMVVCRNLVIYLTLDAQRKALSLFHFALKREGVLVLGTSEGLAELADDFDVIDARRSVFRKGSDRRLIGRFRMPASPPALHETRETPPVPTLPGTAGTATSRFIRGRPPNLMKAYDALMAAYVPPGLLVSAAGELAHTFGDASRFLRPPAGAATLYASDLVLPELRLPLISAMARVQKAEETVCYAGIRLDVPGEGMRQVRLSVRPLPELRPADYVLVTFESADAPAVHHVQDAAEPEVLSAGTLEEELQYTREQLQATVEELETSNEELQATNEELIASNEELQSTNEELHSVNEELSTLNQDHEAKITELQMVTEETNNLLRSIDISTVFVDQNRRIRKFTPNAARQFGLMKHDINRSITQFRSLLGEATVLADLEQVNAGHERVEREIRDVDGRDYLLRILPYERGDGKTDGCVISFIDVERIKESSVRLSRAFAELELLTHILGKDLAAAAAEVPALLRPVAARFASAGAGSQEIEVGDAVHRALEAGSRLESLITELRGLGLIETGGAPIVTVALDDVIQAAIGAKLAGSGASVQVGEGLPTVLADSGQLAGLFGHLFENAVGYADGDPITIRIDALTQGAQVIVEIEDDGAGDRMRERREELDFFFRGRLPEGGLKSSWSGIGLAMVRRVVERHGGDVWVDEASEKCTRVKFSLRSGVVTSQAI
jgi:two-component system CheB/CheR fusion protein